ncbi:hypothetical protein [Schumannella soli]|uniref:Uncharacterized protein n=1 Tax=Schumannella soli TaxID=2590779 RepID=A0A506XZQ4_9MICO|nr:hypothetical protein [Schumannella soli]TPW75696.1 hypothetical protein FJ657_07410 [Schumannella soli]
MLAAAAHDPADIVYQIVPVLVIALVTAGAAGIRWLFSPTRRLAESLKRDHEVLLLTPTDQPRHAQLADLLAADTDAYIRVRTAAVQRYRVLESSRDRWLRLAIRGAGVALAVVGLIGSLVFDDGLGSAAVLVMFLGTAVGLFSLLPLALTPSERHERARLAARQKRWKELVESWHARGMSEPIFTDSYLDGESAAIAEGRSAADFEAEWFSRPEFDVTSLTGLRDDDLAAGGAPEARPDARPAGRPGDGAQPG